MKAILYLQGSLRGLNCRDCPSLFMERVDGRPLLGILFEEATASGCFDRVVFVTSADACDDPIVEYLESAWPAVEPHRVEADSPFALGPASRRDQLLTSVDYSGILSVEGFKAIAPRYARDPSQVAFILDVNDAPLCSRRYFEKALPLARETGFFAGIAPGATSLCGFPMRAFERMSGHQRALRVGEAATARERVERAIQEIRRDGHLASESEIEAVHGWQRARAERYGPYRGGSVAHMLRDWVTRHADAAPRERFARETAGEAVSITSRPGLEMVRAVCELPGSDDAPAGEQWLRRFEERAPHREGQRRFYPEYPSYLEVELTSHCNLACKFCPQTRLTRPKGDLEYDEFERLLDRVGDFVFLLNFSGFGEPTLHPRLFDFIRLAKSRGIPRVEIETNGTRINEAFLQEIFESGLDVLAVNLDALDEAGESPFGSVYELVRHIIERRGEAARPFIVLQRVNMAAPGQDSKIQRDFTLWYDVADAVVIRPFNTYRGTFPDKRVINFAPLERCACKKLLISTLVLSSGQPVMCEQCFDGEHAVSAGQSDGGLELLGESGENPFLRRLRLDQNHGRVSEFCAPCTQWYQQDVVWTTPETNRLWFERALARAARRVADGLLTNGRERVARTQLPEIIRRSGDHDDALRAAFEQKVGRERWAEAQPEGMPVLRGRIGTKGSGRGELAHPIACAVLGERLYVTDAGNRCISAFLLDGEFETSFGETGEYDERHDRLPDIAALDGEILVAERERIQRFAPGGELLGALTPDWRGATLINVAPGASGHLWIATDRGEVLLLNVGSGKIVRSVRDPSWLKVLVNASPESNELFAVSIDRNELFIFDLDGTFVRRVGREQLGRLNWPNCMVGCSSLGYAVSNAGSREILFLSPELRSLGALPTPGWTGKIAYRGNRLYAVTGGDEESCLAWEFQPTARTVMVSGSC